MSVSADTMVTINVTDTDTTHTIATNGDVLQFAAGNTKTFYTPANAPTVAKQWSGTLSLAAATQTLDLTSLTGLRGSTVTFASVRAIWVKNNAGTATWSVAMGNAASNIFAPFLSASTATITIPKGGQFFLENPDTTPWTVDGTHKNLMFDPGANTFTITVLIIGS